MNSTFNLNTLKAADRIVLPKSGIGLIQHHAIYIGKDNNGNRLYVENAIGKGVQIVKETYLFRDGYELTRVERFNGSEHQRKVAVKFAIQQIGKHYDLFSFNCEHYANTVQHNNSYSKQVGNGVLFGLFALIVGVALAE